MLRIALAALALTAAAAGSARADFPSYDFTGYGKVVDTVGHFGPAGETYFAPIKIHASEFAGFDNPDLAQGVQFTVEYLGDEAYEVEYGNSFNDPGNYINLDARPIVITHSVGSDTINGLVIFDQTSNYAGYWTTRYDQGLPQGSTEPYDTVYLYRTSSAPEPSTWALMLAGVGLAGIALRARRRPVALA